VTIELQIERLKASYEVRKELIRNQEVSTPITLHILDAAFGKSHLSGTQTLQLRGFLPGDQRTRPQILSVALQLHQGVRSFS
jgi:hypothetical protein